MDQPLHIVIPTHGRPNLLKRTLDSLAECAIPETLVQTIVIENGGRNGAKQVVAEASPNIRARYRFTPKGNKSHALNLALEDINDGLVIFFDDDIRIAPNLLEAYRSEAGEFGEGHYFGGPFDADYEKAPPEWLKEYLPPSAVGWQLSADESSTPTSVSFYGCNWAAFASDLENIGGFDVELGPSCVATGEETDMQIRLKAGGAIPRYVAAAKVWHYVPADRCSVEWAIARAYQAAAGSAMLKRKRNLSRLKYLWKAVSWKFSPWWALHRSMSKNARDERTRFRAAYMVARHCGKVDNYFGVSKT